MCNLSGLPETRGNRSVYVDIGTATARAVRPGVAANVGAFCLGQDSVKRLGGRIG